MDLTKYSAVLVHGMVMAFASKSPVRDWLKAEKRLEGKKVYLFVTANRWFLDKLYKQLGDLLARDKAGSVDAVSAATKKMDDAAKEAAVRAFVAKLK
jgi:lactam utilization protein B